MKRLSKRKLILLVFFIVIIVGLIIPQNLKMPVDGATGNSYHPKSFWFYPWGKSGTHKGVDIFAKEGTTISSSTSGLVIYTGQLKLGGNVVLILGPKWRLHYYAHLKNYSAGAFTFVNKMDAIGSVGTSGNAKGKPPHLHYAIITLIPYLWLIDSDKQGWKKMFYLNPINYLKGQ